VRRNRPAHAATADQAEAEAGGILRSRVALKTFV
jgi:hypothetical protein